MYRVCLTHTQGCISKISKLILFWRPQPNVQRSWLEKKNYIFLIFFSNLYHYLPCISAFSFCRKFYFLLLHTKFLPLDLFGSVAEKPDIPGLPETSHKLVSCGHFFHYFLIHRLNASHTWKCWNWVRPGRLQNLCTCGE